MKGNWKSNVFRVLAAVFCFGILGAVSCTQGGDTGGGDETAKKYKGKGPCG